MLTTTERAVSSISNLPLQSENGTFSPDFHSFIIHSTLTEMLDTLGTEGLTVPGKGMKRLTGSIAGYTLNHVYLVQ